MLLREGTSNTVAERAGSRKESSRLVKEPREGNRKQSSRPGGWRGGGGGQSSTWRGEELSFGMPGKKVGPSCFK